MANTSIATQLELNKNETKEAYGIDVDNDNENNDEKDTTNLLTDEYTANGGGTEIETVQIGGTPAKKSIVELQIDIGSVKELDTISRQFTGQIYITLRWKKKDTETDEPDKDNQPKILPLNLEDSFIDTDDQIIIGPRTANKSQKYDSYFDEKDGNEFNVWELVQVLSGVWTITVDATSRDPLLDFPFDKQLIDFQFHLVNVDKFTLKLVKNYKNNPHAIQFRGYRFKVMSLIF